MNNQQPPPSYSASTTTQQPGYNPAYPNPGQATMTAPGYNPAYTQPTQTQPPAYGAGVQTGAPGVGYGNASTLQAGTYVMGTTVAIGMSPVSSSRDPVSVTCQFCNKVMVTRVEYINGQTVTCCALLLCLVGLSCGCCLIPCCIQSYKDADHYCTECNMKLGTCLPNAGFRGQHY